MSQTSSPKLPSQSSLCPRRAAGCSEPPSWWLPSSVHPGIPSSLSGLPLTSPLPQIFWFPDLPCGPGSCLQSYLSDHSNIRVGSRSTSQIMPALNTHAILRRVSLLPCSHLCALDTCLPLICTWTHLPHLPQLHSLLWGLLTLPVLWREHLPCDLGLYCVASCLALQEYRNQAYPMASHIELWSHVN